MTARHLDSEISSYGGDVQIIATTAEIDRVIAELHGLELWLRNQIELQAFVSEPMLHIRLAFELPPILEKLAVIRDSCGRAADSYFGAEASISKELRESQPPKIENIATGFAGIGALFGLLTETAVTANLVGMTNAVAAPNSIFQLASRLNDVSELGPGWIRIEKFREPATPVSAAEGYVLPQPARYVVYIPGTQDWGPKTGENPLDLTSDLSAISKTGFAGSERAVAAAMEQAGVKTDSAVLFVGHSQGGIIAANLATRFAGSKTLTFGAPIGQLSEKLKAPTISVEHDGDLVPGLDSRPNPLAPNWVTVRQKIAGNPLEQHAMAGYLNTANEIDQSTENGGLARLRSEIANFAGDQQADGQALDFEIVRTRESAKP